MIFSSITFLFFFLPALLLLYPFAGKWQNALLLVASLFFYTWGEGVYLGILLVSIAINYLAGRAIGNCRARGQDGKSLAAQITLTLAIIADFVLLGFYKYADFLTDNLNWLLSHLALPSVSLTPAHPPLGISFFTFQAVAYLVDIYRGQVTASKRLTDFTLFISFFPRLAAGPIVRYLNMAAALKNRTVTAEGYAAGIERFVFGLAKKVLLANPLGQTADQIYALPLADLSSPLAWLAAVCYMLQIYFDFSGYTDMAIGLGRMFGFHLPENFNYPYISRGIQEFWRRWHITLSSWFRDYLYIPLGGNRHGSIRTYVNLLTVFILCGLWHGANWTFVFWGLYHGFFIICEHLAKPLTNRHPVPPWLAYPATVFIIMIGWVFFRCDTLPQAISHIAAMFGQTEASGGIVPFINRKFVCELAVATALSMPLWPWLRQRWVSYVGDSTPKALFAASCRVLGLAALLYAVITNLAAGSYNPFIYFRF
ncbi:MAG TPA: MBOAT family protein [Desulfobulbaceae bacterium]|nr:MBOAT family protein [Desulfobulbaceae bacterium]